PGIPQGDNVNLIVLLFVLKDTASHIAISSQLLAVSFLRYLQLMKNFILHVLIQQRLN
ncbi:MAG: hypothetical protein RLZZ04_4108, partial [Cyanobacteriota bacterium]